MTHLLEVVVALAIGAILFIILIFTVRDYFKKCKLGPLSASDELLYIAAITIEAIATAVIVEGGLSML